MTFEDEAILNAEYIQTQFGKSVTYQTIHGISTTIFAVIDAENETEADQGFTVSASRRQYVVSLLKNDVSGWQRGDLIIDGDDTYSLQDEIGGNNLGVEIQALKL